MLGKKGRFWIGLNDKHLEGSFYWADNSPQRFTNWNGGQPANSYYKDCVDMSSTVTAGGWSVVPCSSTQGYICETGKLDLPWPSSPTNPLFSPSLYVAQSSNLIHFGRYIRVATTDNACGTNLIPQTNQFDLDVFATTNLFAGIKFVWIKFDVCAMYELGRVWSFNDIEIVGGCNSESSIGAGGVGCVDGGAGQDRSICDDDSGGGSDDDANGSIGVGDGNGSWLGGGGVDDDDNDVGGDREGDGGSDSCGDGNGGTDGVGGGDCYCHTHPSVFLPTPTDLFVPAALPPGPKRPLFTGTIHQRLS